MKAVVLFLFVLLHGSGAQNDDIVCVDQQEVCECPSSASVCNFTLEIEELQTFTSYRMRSDSRDTRGYTYYIDNGGYMSSRTPLASDDQDHCLMNEGQQSMTDPDFDFTFGERRCSRPMFVDGVTYRLFIAVNGQIPGPTLIVTEDQTVKVTVYNKLTSEGITIHWHGMHQRNTPWMDGVGFLTQAPITPGGRFDYIFKATPAGTHWYHSHTGAQRTDGLFGALIVKERNFAQSILGQGTFTDEPDRHTLTLLDWQREASLDLFVQIHSSLRFYGLEKGIDAVPTRSDQIIRYNTTVSEDRVEVGPVPYWSGLINGRGRYDANTFSKLSQFNVTSGEKYRFRLIGAQSLYAYRFEIYGHKLTVIATDGHFINPVEVDYIIIHSGERYDFLLNANKESGQNYWIQAKTLEENTWPGSLESRPHIAEAVLHYDDSNPVRRLFPSYAESNFISENRICNPCKAINCPFERYSTTEQIECIHLNTLTAPSQLAEQRRPDITNSVSMKFFNFGFEGNSNTSAINGRNFRLPSTPYQTYRGQYESDKDDINRVCSSDCSGSSCICTYVEEINRNESYRDQQEPTVVMALSAVGSDINRNFSHPIHLHGHSFYIVSIGHGMYSRSTESPRLLNNNQDVVCMPDDTNCSNPMWREGMIPADVREAGMLPSTAVRKDTVIVPAGGYVVIAFVADNPGYWFLHCHIEVHQLEGMSVIIQEYSEDYHNTPPNDINKVGTFVWEVDEFNSKLNFMPGTIPSRPPVSSPSSAEGSEDIKGLYGIRYIYYTFLVFVLPYVVIAAII